MRCGKAYFIPVLVGSVKTCVSKQRAWLSKWIILHLFLHPVLLDTEYELQITGEGKI